MIKHFIKDLILGILIGLVILTIGMFIMLLNGPVNISFLNNWLAGKIEQQLKGTEVTINDLEFAWGGRTLPLAINASEVRFNMGQGQYLLTIPLSKFELDYQALFKGTIQLQKMVLNEPEFHIRMDSKFEEDFSNLNLKTLALSSSELDITTNLMGFLPILEINPNQGTLLKQGWIETVNTTLTDWQLASLKHIELKNGLIHFINDEGVQLSEHQIKRFIIDGNHDVGRELTFFIANLESDISLNLGYHTGFGGLNKRDGHVKMAFNRLDPSKIPEFLIDHLPETVREPLKQLSNAHFLNGEFQFEIDPAGRPTAAKTTLSLEHNQQFVATGSLLGKFNQGIIESEWNGRILLQDLAKLTKISMDELNLEGEASADLSFTLNEITKLTQANVKMDSSKMIWRPTENFGKSFLSSPLTLRQVSGILDYRDQILTITPFEGILADINSNEAVTDLEKPTRLSITGRIKGFEPDSQSLAIDMNMQLSDYPMAWLNRHWPQSIGEETREWVLDNIRLGFIPTADFFTEILYDKQKAIWDVPQFNGSFALEQAVVRYIDGMTVARDVNAFTNFDQSNFELTINKGWIGELDIANSKITRQSSSQTDSAIKTDLKASGSVADAYLLLNQAPIRFDPNLFYLDETIKPEGMLEGVLQLDIPIGDAPITLNQLDLNFKETSYGLRFNANSYPVYSDALTLSMTQDRLKITGDWQAQSLSLTSQPAFTIDYSRDLSKKDTNDQQLILSGVITPKLLSEFDQLPIASQVNTQFEDGEATFTLDLKLPNGESQITEYQLAIDLTEAELNDPKIAYQKPIGIKANLQVTGDYQTGNGWQLKAIDYQDSKGSKIAGSLSLFDEFDGIESLAIAPLKLGKNNLSSLKLTQLENQPLTLEIKGDQLWLKLDSVTQAGDDLPSMTVNIDLATLTLQDFMTIHQLSGDLTIMDDQYQSIDLEFKPTNQDEESSIYVEMAYAQQPFQFEPVKQEPIQVTAGTRTLSIMGSDLTALATAFNLEEKLAGESFELIAFDTPEQKMLGKLRVDLFSVKNVPALTRLLQLLSGSGIFQALGNEGLSFQSLNADFQFNDGKIEAIDAVADGFSMGMTARGIIDPKQDEINLNGVVTPANMLNKLIGLVPGVGGFLTGTRNEGVLASRYRITGSLDDPLIESDPASFFQPGILRDIIGAASGVSE